MVYEEACAKVNTQKEEFDDLERQLEAAPVQVQLPTLPPSLPSDDGDWDQGRVSHVDCSEDEARRDVEAGLGMDIYGATRKRGRTRTPRGRSRSPAPPVRAGRSRLLNLLPRPHRSSTFSVLHSWRR